MGVLYLRVRLFRFSDINECETLPDLCTNGRCINTLGSYRCSCNKAYKVDRTGTHCNGKWTKSIVYGNARWLHEYSTPVLYLVVIEITIVFCAWDDCTKNIYEYLRDESVSFTQVHFHRSVDFRIRYYRNIMMAVEWIYHGMVEYVEISRLSESRLWDERIV